MKLLNFRSLMASLTTSADVGRAIRETDDLLASARTSLALMEAERRALLIGDDDAALDRFDGRLAEARRTVDRLEARAEALATQHAEVLATEEAEALEAQRAAAEARVLAERRWIATRYVRIAAELVEAVGRIRAADAGAELANRALAAAGRPERVGKCEISHAMYDDKIIVNVPTLAGHMLLPPIALPSNEPVQAHNEDFLKLFGLR